MQDVEGGRKLRSFMCFITLAKFLHALGLRVLKTSGWCK